MIECAQSCYQDALELVGREITAEELAHALQRDQAFYRQSGGGVTFSGGEAALQAEFVAETARLLKKSDCHVTLDTAGCVPWEKLALILSNADAVLYDIKAFDSEIHRRCTGAGNALILENAKRIAALGKDMYVRMVIVPQMNDQWDDVLDRLRFVAALGECVRQVDILKYHTLGEGKYLRLGMEYPLRVPACDDDFIGKILSEATAMGIKAVIGG